MTVKNTVSLSTYRDRLLIAARQPDPKPPAPTFSMTVHRNNEDHIPVNGLRKDELVKALQQLVDDDFPIYGVEIFSNSVIYKGDAADNIVFP